MPKLVGTLLMNSSIAGKLPELMGSSEATMHRGVGKLEIKAPLIISKRQTTIVNSKRKSPADLCLTIHKKSEAFFSCI